MQPMHQHNHEWYDPLHIITWPLWYIDLDLARSSPSSRSISAKSCPSFTASRSVASKPWLALHHCNWYIKPSLVLIFSILVTWLHVMSHMQWASSHHHLWTNHMCISICHIISLPNVVTQLSKPNKNFSDLWASHLTPTKYNRELHACHPHWHAIGRSSWNIIATLQTLGAD
jgi:hypothetical protein